MGPLGSAYFTSICEGVGIQPPKYQKKIQILLRIAPVGKPLRRFLKVLGDFMLTIILQKVFKFGVIRFTGYRVYAEKPRARYLGRIFPCTQ